MSQAAIDAYDEEISALQAQLAILEIRRGHSIEGQSIDDDRYMKTIEAIERLTKLRAAEAAGSPFMIIET